MYIFKKMVPWKKVLKCFIILYNKQMVFGNMGILHKKTGEYVFNFYMQIGYKK